ncbi:MAG: hypothetical protein MJZ12_00225 [Prevotella sp.]|nr:hypothetical protein [Prevotella sp.]
MTKLVKTAVDTRTFVEIWSAWDRIERNTFYDKALGLRDSSIRSYGTGRRKASTPALKCLVDAFRKIGMNVGDGRYLFPC